jgi:3-hydroxyisobutyrate dehydrogenase-like beta-hydroxyacid dehydrogenase
MTVAVLGLGRMGRALAGRLLDSDQQLRVWNRSPGRAAELVDRGAIEAESAADAADAAEFIVVSLTGDDAVRQVLLPEGRPIGGPATTVIDCSTVSPTLSREEAAAFENRFVASPIAGAPQAVESGKALFIVAGAPAAVSRAEPILTALAGSRRDAGDDPGNAAVIKVLNNYLLLSGVAALADVVALAQANGIADRDLTDLLQHLPTVAPGVANRVPGLLGSEHEPWFSIDLGRKDLGLAAELASRSGIRLGLIEDVTATYDRTAEAGLGDKDLTAVIETLRQSS